MVIMVITCHLFVGAQDAPSVKSVSDRAVCVEISVSSDVKV